MKLFWTILKYFGMTAGSLTILWGAFTLLDDIRDGIGDIKEDVIKLQVAVDSIADQSKKGKKQIQNNSFCINKNTSQLIILTDSYLEYLKNDDRLSKDVFFDYMDPFLEYMKNNLSSDINNQWFPTWEEMRRYEHEYTRQHEGVAEPVDTLNN